MYNHILKKYQNLFIILTVATICLIILKVTNHIDMMWITALSPWVAGNVFVVVVILSNIRRM